MALPWLRIFDIVIGVTDIARSTRGRPAQAPPNERLATGTSAIGHLETRLAGVVVAALKEAFDRDTRRLELEREVLEAERARAERAMRLELLRQAGEREIGRLRLLAAVAVASWLGTLFFSARLVGGGIAPRVAIGVGWALLLGALAATFVAQARVTQVLDRMDEGVFQRDALSSGVAGALAPWLIVAGLAVIGAAVLV